MTELIVEEEDKRKRLDTVGLEKLPMLSRAYVQRLINESRILVNDQLSKPGYRLRLEDKVTIHFDPAELEQIESIELPILYEDENVIVINKPSGVISHARGKFWNEPSVASFVREKTAQSGERAGIVHRLDRATSGVMICAKNHDTLSWLQKQFSDRVTTKVYQAVITGALEPAAALIDMPIERNPMHPQTFRVGQQGKPAQTTYKTTLTGTKHSLVELTPKTGRTHQLRVHLKQLGHPIVGDTLYEGEEADRLYLHAASLTIALPGDEQQTFSAPIPPEFKDNVLQNE